HGLGTAYVQRLETLEGDPIGLLQTWNAERALGAFGRPAQDQLAGDGCPGACGFAPSRLAAARHRHDDQRQHSRPESESAVTPHGFLPPSMQSRGAHTLNTGPVNLSRTVGQKP